MTTMAATTKQDEAPSSSLSNNEKSKDSIHQHQHQQQKNHQKKKQPNEEHHPSHKQCLKCDEVLPRHVFPRKEYIISSNPTCHSCRKQQTAQRLQQPTKPQPKQGNRSKSGLKRRPNNFGYCNYVDKLFGMNCFQDLVTLQVFSSAKDVSESMAVLQAVKNHATTTTTSVDIKKTKRSSTTCLCIGDGATPRTAVLACFLERRKHNWNHVVSIDPMMHSNWQGREPHGVQGLYGFGGTLEEFVESPKTNEYPNHRDEKVEEDDEESQKCDFLVLLCVHSHARLIGNCDVDKIRARYPSTTTSSSDSKTLPDTILVSLPCCPKFRSQRDVGRPPDFEYEDDCVFSACRKVQVWNFPSSPLVEGDGHAAKSSFPLGNIDGMNMDYCQEVP